MPGSCPRLLLFRLIISIIIGRNRMKRKVLITGASRGIGREIAEIFAKAGDDLILTCRENIDILQEFSKGLAEEFDVDCRAFACDMSDYDKVKELFDTIGGVDILINNAGVAWMGLLTDMEVSDWRRVLGTNLDSLFYTCKMAVPYMVRKKSGKIINVSSVWGNVGASCEVAYSASKGGANSFTRALAKELAPSGIQVNAIACGVIDTDMNRDHLSEQELQDLAQEIPIGRMGQAKEVAEMCLMLCEGPEYLTGQVITMDGGWI
jgi:3-oxoacyl-[acyl-carrier protein] reductase